MTIAACFRRALLPPLVVLSILAGCASPASQTREAKEPPLPPLSQFTCRRTVQAFLAPAGLTLEQLQDTTVHNEMLAGGDQVAYYRVTTRPQGCSSGALKLVILADCSIDSWQTTPPCRLPALELPR